MAPGIASNGGAAIAAHRPGGSRSANVDPVISDTCLSASAAAQWSDAGPPAVTA